MTAPDLLEELERLSAAATAGPWPEPEGTVVPHPTKDRPNGPTDGVRFNVARFFNEADAEFIVALVNAYRSGLLAASGTGERPADERTWHCIAQDAGYPADHCSPEAPVHDGNDYCGWVPTPPDAGSGTPSDDGRWTVWLEGPITDPAHLATFPQGTVALDDVGSLRQHRYGNTHMAGGWTSHGNNPLSTSELVESGRRPVWIVHVDPAAPSGTTGATTGGES